MAKAILEFSKMPESCRECPYGEKVTSTGKYWGWACRHPDIITNLQGLVYGRYHKGKGKPKWCPALKEVEHDG